MKEFKVSEFIHFQEVEGEKDIFIGWNRFFPTFFIMNRFVRELLTAVKKRKSIRPNEEVERLFKQLLKYKFIYDTQKDPSQDDFVKMMAESLAMVKQQGDEFYRLRKAYNQMAIFNDECNLACPYCVNQYQRKTSTVKKNADEIREVTRRCIDGYMAKKLEQEEVSGSKGIKLFFNGGEILLAWEVLKETLHWLTHKYKGVNFNFQMNTNLTLMTEEIAQCLAQHNFKIYISIDGYEGAHNRTRRYHNGKGTFADVLKGLAIYRRFHRKNPPHAFQGTIDFIDEFNPEAVYAMEKHGFSRARLAPNLLNVKAEDALKKAGVMGKFLELNERNKFQVTEVFFSNAKDRINQDDYRFSFNCLGLSCCPDRAIYLNISTLQVSLICAYVHAAWIPLADLGYDIYHPNLWEKAYGFIRERSEAIRKYCFDCHLVGLCSGGCIYTGLDNENRPNKAACTYQEKLWHDYINRVYRQNKASS